MVDNGNCMHTCSSHAKLMHVMFSCDDDGCILGAYSVNPITGVSPLGGILLTCCFCPALL